MISWFLWACAAGIGVVLVFFGADVFNRQAKSRQRAKPPGALQVGDAEIEILVRLIAAAAIIIGAALIVTCCARFAVAMQDHDCHYQPKKDGCTL